MSKTNFFVKHLKNTNNFINNLLEKNLNKLNFKNLRYLSKNNKVILTFVALFLIFISYLLIPTFYNQSSISKELKIKFQNKLNINFQFSEDLNYSFFPRPHFTTNNTTIFNKNGEISKIDKLKIFISLNNFFSLENIEIRNIIFENANFNLNKKNYNIFLELLNQSFKDGGLTIKNSNIFFRNLDDEVLFINKILKMKYYYNKKELKNIFYSDNEVFNVPFSMVSFLNEDKNKIFSKINFNLMKLKIENEIVFKKDKKIGKSEFVFNKLKQNAEYQIEKNFFNFHIFDKIEEPKNNYKGTFNFKPFYASLEGDLDQINLNYLFGSNAIIAQLLKTEIFNNKNIDFKLNISAESVFNNQNIKNIVLKSKIQDGLIDTDKTKFYWRDFAEFELAESLIFVRNGELVLDGKIKINVKDYKKIYKFLLTPKKYRNEIRQIDLSFTYNFDQKIAELKDIVIDDKINEDVNKTLNNIFLKKDDLRNKIYFKNLLNEAIKSYAG